MSDTPRTDEEQYDEAWTGLGAEPGRVVAATFARQLEGELAAVKDAAMKFFKAVGAYIEGVGSWKELTAAGDALRQICKS